MRQHSRLIGGILLVSGTTIGAGMLALPIATGFEGFIPSLFLFIGYWLYMTFTAFLLLEANLWMAPHTNLISMARKTLGPWGAGLSWITYLFLLYSLTTAYLAGSGPIVIDFIKSFTGYTIPFWAGSIPLLLIFGFFVYKGMRSVDYVNRLLMLGLIAAYGIMVLLSTPYVEAKNLLHQDWSGLSIAISVVATSFGFHIIIPSLATYLDRNIGKLKAAILIGSAIPLAVYIIWEFIALGIIPLEGPLGLKEGYAHGSNGATLLADILHNAALATVARCFAFFAIVTSFLGVSISLSHFLADGFKIPRTRGGRILTFMLTFLPPLAFALLDPRAFLSALEFAGAFGVVILLGFLPALMVWSGRYRMGLSSTFKTPGGKIALLAAMLFSLAIMVLEIVKKLSL